MGPDVDDADMAELAGENGGSWGELLDGFPHTNQAGPSLHNLAISEETHQEKDAVATPAEGLSISGHSLGLLNLGSHVKNLLVTCAAAIPEEKMGVAEVAMQDLRKTVSVFGDPGLLLICLRGSLQGFMPLAPVLYLQGAQM